MHYVYILYSPSLDRFYTGETIGVDGRLLQHNAGYYERSGTSLTQDWKLFLSIDCRDRAMALQLERFIKRQKSSRFIRRLKAEPEVLLSVKDRF